jgi:uncharacterized protein (TIGR03435 family)
MKRLLFLVAMTAIAQSPRFEVATVKPASPDKNPGNYGLETNRGRLIGDNLTLKRYIMSAYGARPHQVLGGPEWLDTERFDIAGKADGNVGDDILRKMLQALLTERFKLTFHREGRTMQAFVLDAPKGEGKLKRGDGGEGKTINGRGDLTVENTTMDRFADVLSRQMDLPVVNRTGIDGVFSVKLRWTPESITNPPAEAPPPIYTAIQEQLGLRLRSQKTEIEVFLIDGAEKPSEN